MQRIRGYKYRAYPDRSQREFFAKNFGCCRFVYNHYLEKSSSCGRNGMILSAATRCVMISRMSSRKKRNG